ncbi:hypothetical protein [cf. Phormidesmis sp. LEGE 11477]|uniref:hypothetical protein n=1 Tax=cf. Phormidesmis sp. LEGE 11477 TaxID=1828680 RepID=UPI0018804AA0|nr:hypothetical protein [cf. Phormidesmis sp. LEGE 11477]MBE9063331.1 hypothetical protein [cf. Phormidesmis sp. LEGE 11477]
MSSHPYYYFTVYQKDVSAALHSLKQQEFEAGRYSPVMDMFLFEFPPVEDSPTPGVQHPSIETAIEDTDGCGTGTILDIERIAEQPAFLASCPLSSDWLIKLLGTEFPTHELVERIICQEEIRDEDGVEDVWDEFADEMGGGESRYLIVYKDNQPSELFFMGYSVD